MKIIISEICKEYYERISELVNVYLIGLIL